VTKKNQPQDVKALAKRLKELDAEIKELAESAYVLNNENASGDAADGYVRVLKEMRKVLLRSQEQGHLDKLSSDD
jgi:uncharacterized protein YecE (DUF72 family)